MISMGDVFAIPGDTALKKSTPNSQQLVVTVTVLKEPHGMSQINVKKAALRDQG